MAGRPLSLLTPSVRRSSVRAVLIVGALLMICGGCVRNSLAPVTPVAQVDLPRFMGDWYVIGNIPTFPERHAYDAIESYALESDGRIQTTFRYRNNSFDAPVKTMHPIGRVVAGTNNAVWSMQFVWPIKAEYIIAYLSDDYGQTIIARTKRDYVWIMARSPTLSEADYAAAVERVRALGYDISKIRRVPQRTEMDRRNESTHVSAHD